MFHKQRLTELEQAQRLLVSQADFHRGVLRRELGVLRERLGWVHASQQRFRASRPWVMAGAAVAGLLGFRFARRLIRWTPAALLSLRVARLFFGK